MHPFRRSEKVNALKKKKKASAAKGNILCSDCENVGFSLSVAGRQRSLIAEGILDVTIMGHLLRLIFSPRTYGGRILTPRE